MLLLRGVGTLIQVMQQHTIPLQQRWSIVMLRQTISLLKLLMGLPLLMLSNSRLILPK